MAFRTETHSAEYSLRPEGSRWSIPKGYGAGNVVQLLKTPIEIPEANERHVRFNVYSGKVPEQFLLKQMGNRWMLMNVTPYRGSKKWQKLLGGEKGKMKEIPVSGVKPETRGQTMQPKVDGAHGLVVLEPAKPPRMFSYRTAKNKTGLIEHTHKFPGWWKPSNLPPGAKPTVLRAEFFAKDKKTGRTAPPRVTGGILNSSVFNSRRKQEEQGLQLDLRTFGVQGFQGGDYKAQQRFLRSIERQDPRLKTMPTAVTMVEKQKMFKGIFSGKDKLTREGVVLRDQSGQVIKAKKRPDFDVYVREIVPGNKPGEMGAFRYSLTPKGRIVGAAGTGFKQSLRRQMFRSPSSFIGRVAKVRAQEQFPSGALRAPVFTGEWHLEKGIQSGAE